MKIAVLHVNSSGIESTSPTMRIAKFVAEELAVPLVHDVATARRHKDTVFDILFVKYGMLKFSSHRDEALRIYSRAKYVINLENDYLFALDKRFSTPDEVWSTVATVAGRTRYVNWNILTRLPLRVWKEGPGNLPIPENKGLVYYGAHREDRVGDFKLYFKDAPYPVCISTFRGRKKFLETCGDNIQVVGAFRDPFAPANWQYTVYIADETSNTLYCSPATRFYECLQMGLTQFIDVKAVGTFKEAGIEVPPTAIVSSPKELKKLAKEWEHLQTIERVCWWKDYAKVIRKQFKTACKDSGVHK